MFNHWKPTGELLKQGGLLSEKRSAMSSYSNRIHFFKYYKEHGCILQSLHFYDSMIGNAESFEFINNSKSQIHYLSKYDRGELRKKNTFSLSHDTITIILHA